MNTHLEKFYKAVEGLKDSDLEVLGMQHLKALLKTSYLEDLIHDSLSKLNLDPNYYPTHASLNHWHILNTNAFNLTLIKMKKEHQTKYINSYSFDKIIVPITGAILYNSYKQMNPYPENILDKSKRLIPVATKKVLTKNTPFMIKKYESIFSYQGALNDDVMILSFSCKNTSSYGWEYDAKTLHPLRLVSNSKQSARLEHTCKLLGALGNISSLPNLFHLLNNSHHNVRWAAASAIMNINFNKGIEALHLLEHDTHPEIVESVKNGLHQISKLNIN